MLSLRQTDILAPDPAANSVTTCSMCGPRFCSMRISQDIRDEAEAGMRKKAKEFREMGGEIYVPETVDS